MPPGDAGESEHSLPLSLIVGALAPVGALVLVASLAVANTEGRHRDLISETSSIRVEAQLSAARDFPDQAAKDLDLVGGCGEDAN